jgi:hypothetical protein
LMRKIFSTEDWSSEAERRVRARLENAGLQFAFHRPLGQAARTAMFHALSELVDCGAIDYNRARFLYESLCPYDHALMLAEPSLDPRRLQKSMA